MPKTPHACFKPLATPYPPRICRLKSRRPQVIRSLIGPSPDPTAALGTGVIFLVVNPTFLVAAPLHSRPSIVVSASIAEVATIIEAAPIGSGTPVILNLLVTEPIEPPVRARATVNLGTPIP